jgi:hypothetical protein
MPRHGRLDVPAALNHMTVRGIDNSTIALHARARRHYRNRPLQDSSRLINCQSTRFTWHASCCDTGQSPLFCADLRGFSWRLQPDDSRPQASWDA